MRIAFIWQGLDGRYKYQWRDGLYAALKLIEKNHQVRYFDFPLVGIHEFNPDVVLYWESPSTQRGKDAVNWQTVCELPYKKCLLFAGGPLQAMDVKDFDLVFTESQTNDEDCERQGIPYKRAFGVNTQIFKPQVHGLKYHAFMQATFADWKRHELFAQAVGNRGAVAGRYQEHDTNGYNACVKYGVTIFDEQPASEVNRLITSSHCVLNTAAYWGGGQRCTLEAMAAAVPVIVMSDSPKNREYVEASGGGFIADPNPEAIREAVQKALKSNVCSLSGYAYVYDNWTEKHYASALLEGIKSIL